MKGTAAAGGAKSVSLQCLEVKWLICTRQLYSVKLPSVE